MRKKNILLNRGNKKNESGIRGSDGRMAHETDLELALNIVVNWVSQRGTAVDLYIKFFNKNVELGYREGNEKVEKKLNNLVG